MPTGKTKDAGWQIGVRRTVGIPLEEAWSLVTSSEGVACWLGAGAPDTLWQDGAYTLPDGSSGEVRVFKRHSHLRMTWAPKGWPRPSTIQVRVLDKGDRSVIAFHQEHMPDANSREERRTHFKAALYALEALMDA